MPDPGRLYPYIDGKEFSIDAQPECVGPDGELRIKMVINMIDEKSIAAPGDTIVCAKCRRSYLFKEMSAVKKHLKRRHGLTVNNHLLSCQYCEETFNRVQYYGGVLMLNQNDRSQCKLCHEVMTDKYVWALHILQQHTRAETTELKNIAEHLVSFKHVQIEIQLYTVAQGYRLKSFDPTGGGKSLKFRATFSEDANALFNEDTKNHIKRFFQKPWMILDKFKSGGGSIFTQLFSKKYEYSETKDHELFEVVEGPKNIETLNEPEHTDYSTVKNIPLDEERNYKAEDTTEEWSTDEDEVEIGNEFLHSKERKEKKDGESNWETEEEITYENYKLKAGKRQNVGVQCPEYRKTTSKPPVRWPYPIFTRQPYRSSSLYKQTENTNKVETTLTSGTPTACEKSILETPTPILRKRSQLSNEFVDNEELPLEKTVRMLEDLTTQTMLAVEKIQGDTTLVKTKSASPNGAGVVGPFGERLPPTKFLRKRRPRVSNSHDNSSDSSDEPGSPMTVQAEVHSGV